MASKVRVAMAAGMGWLGGKQEWTGQERLLLVEALVGAAMARLLLLLPFRILAPRLGTLGQASPGDLPPELEALVRAIGWSIQAVARRVPWNGKCFTQAVTAWIMLRRRGIPGTLHFGVRRDTDQGAQQQFHAWVRSGSVAVTGGSGAGYSTLATFAFPGAHADPRSVPR